MIKNREQLLSHGCVKGRRLAVDIIDYCLSEVDPYKATRETVRYEDEDGLLHVKEDVFDLNNIKNLYVVGAGKATYRIALALEEILGERITDGFVSVKDGQKGSLSRIRISEASHPIPDHRSMEACKEVFKIVDRAGPDDLVITVVTGGSSALCSHPVAGIAFEEKRAVNDLLLRCGSEIKEINTVRKHLSVIKGGRLTRRILPATVVSLCVSDVIYDPMDWNTDWTAPDSSTLADAVAAVIRAEQLGLKPVLLTTSLNGESREAGRTLAAIAKEVYLSSNPVAPPCVLIAGGETIVRMERDTTGKGGPNQELAVGGCLDLEEDEPIVVCAVDSDGSDGPTQIAGAMTDGSTLVRAGKNGFDCFKALMDHNTSEMLKTLDDAVITGSTGSNVNDLAMCIILQHT
jgi:glycerate-2-kinase